MKIMMTIESRLNTNPTDLELFTHKSRTIDILIRKLEAMKYRANRQEMSAINRLSVDFANIEANKDIADNVQGVFYSASQQRWVAAKGIDGKKVYIKSSKDRQKCVDAFNKFVNNNVSIKG